MLMKLITPLIACGLVSAAESFETVSVGALREAVCGYGKLSADTGAAAIVDTKKLVRTGSRALHIQGGEGRTVTLTFEKPTEKEQYCEFWLQRWTRKGSFGFACKALTADGEQVLKETGADVTVGSYGSQVVVKVPMGTTALQFTCNSPEKTGVLLDDLSLLATAPAVKEARQIVVSKLEVVNPGAFPLLKRAPVNPAFAIKVEATKEDVPVESVSFTVYPANSMETVTLRTGSANGLNFADSTVYGTATPDAEGRVSITCEQSLRKGLTWLWVDATPSSASSVGGVVEFRDIKVSMGGRDATCAPVQQRIGYMVAVPSEKVGNQAKKAEDRECIAFRIPGLITTRKGSLVGCFDARYNGERDLCADIDVAVVRSTDGGQTWSAPAVGMDVGPGDANGCGDPCIVEDRRGRIWIQALAAHFSGGAVLGASKSGQGEERTGQWMLTNSTDDGASWSKRLQNPTEKIKEDEWTCILAGPGRGIVTRKGVIVFPAQIWQNGATPRSRSTICYSKDGRKWTFGEGLPHFTSECQVVELEDGSLMLNARNEARSGKRIVYVTQDMGKTWEPHSSNDSALIEPTCQASIIVAKSPKHGRLLLFSNPKSSKARDHMTIRVSKDEGKTWSDGYEYDRRSCAGYSCLTQIDEETIGLFYEVAHSLYGPRGIGFIRMPLETILSETTEPAGTPVASAKKEEKESPKKRTTKRKRTKRD